MEIHSPYVYPTSNAYRKIGGGAGGGGDTPNGGNGNGNGGAANGTGAGPGGETREFQTHIFAPPVTGAPTKKSKFSGQGGLVGFLSGCRFRFQVVYFILFWEA
jgi:hypothetical protein